ncbi:hypothetical protein STENM327S_05149 [Streptomyces tendae]
MIGSGPTGLAAAQQLTRAGHTVAVYERDDRIGGLLRYGIPEFKMEKRHLERRIGQMRAEGTRFCTSTAVGRDVDAAALRARYDAVVIAAGATAWRELTVPGRELAGCTRRWSTCHWPTGCARATSSAPRCPPPGGTSSSSAVATRARTVSVRRCGSARRP